MSNNNSSKTYTPAKTSNSSSRGVPWLIWIAMLVIAVAGIVTHIDSLISMGLVNLANYELLQDLKTNPGWTITAPLKNDIPAAIDLDELRILDLLARANQFKMTDSSSRALVRSIFATGQYHLGIRQAKEHLSLYPKDETMQLMLGAMLWHMGQKEPALEEWGGLSNGCIFLDLAKDYQSAGEDQAAKYWSEVAMAVAPELVEAYLHSGRILLTMDKPDEAYEVLESGLQIPIENAKKCSKRRVDPAVYYNIHLQLGDILFSNHQWQEAKHHFKVLENETQARVAYQRLGQIEISLGNPGEALGYFEKGLTKYPDNTNLLLYKGLAFEKLDRCEDAKLIYEKLLSLDPSNEAVLNRLEQLKCQRP